MVRFGKKAAVVTAAGVLAAMSATGCSSSLNPDAVVATVGDEDISLGVANFYTRMTQGEYETYYASMMGTTAEDMWTQEVDEQGTTMEEQLKDNIMQSLQNMYLMSQHASDYDIALTDEEEQAISDAADQFVADNTEEVRNTVSGNKEDVQKVLELVTIQSRMTEAMQEGVDEEVSDEEAAQKSMDYVLFSYTTTDDSGNSTEMTDEEKENLAATAQEFANQVKNGTDMTDAAEADGVEVQTATFDSESTTPDADLIAAADALENGGDVTDPVETDSGIYVARLTSLLDRDATDTEKETIVEQRRQDQYNSLLEEWRDAAEIDVNERNWNKIDFTYQGITIVTPEEETSEETSTDNTDDSGSAEGSGTSEDSGTDGAE